MLAGFGFIVHSLFQISNQSHLQDQALKNANKIVNSPSSKDKTKKEIKTEQTKTINSFQTGDIIGILTIPVLKSELPIIEGTHEDDLAKGVGHYSKSALPDQENQILLSGHRDTVFRKLGDLKKGDILEIKMPSETYRYEIYKLYIVDKDNTTVIRNTAPKEILTLSTYYPFYFVENAPERYIIEAKRIQ
ncbi:class D sortase [Peribacillus deserti]|nr:class D sortase [Peribacillus deserti]